MGVLMAFSMGGGAARAVVPSVGVLDFAIVRNGKEIGSQVYKFEAAPEGLAVNVQTRINFRLGFVSVHRFNHDSRELWHGNRLVALSSSTSEKNIVMGRTKHKVAVDTGVDDLNVLTDDSSWQAPSSAIPASLWNEKLVESRTLIDTVDGEKLAVNVESLGDDIIVVKGQQLSTHYYRLSGDMKRELWYGRDNMLVRVQFTADDGSQVQYVLH